MPAGRFDQTIYLGPFSTVESINVATLYKPGELGKKIETTANKDYQLVQLDSGATASTGAGVVASGQLAFWKNKSTYLVTNDKVQAIGGPGITTGARNAIAGVFRTAVTAGNYCVIQTRGTCTNVLTAGAGIAIGDQVVADSNALARGVTTAAGTAPPYRSIGVCSVAESGTATGVDIDLPQVP